MYCVTQSFLYITLSVKDVVIYLGSHIVISCLKICPTTLQIKYYYSLLLFELMGMTQFGVKAQVRISSWFKLLN